jgi:hypothetical protein
MALNKNRWALITGLVFLSGAVAQSQVFVVGEKSATADISTAFTPTNLTIPTDKMTERGRRELIRNLEAEQGFAHMSLPVWAGMTLHANGPLTPGPAEYKQMLFSKGEAAAPGDHVIITAMEIKGDRIVLDLNGGPYLKHRFLRHIQMNDTPVVASNEERATGSRITLVFNGPVPEISAPEVKALLQPVIDFGVKSSAQAYADTLPAPLKDAIAAHEVLVGMSHKMVLAALGAPESKMRDQPSGDPNGGRYEEWIYGHVPQTIRFIRFQGDRVTMVEIAALGKPIEIHDKDEMGGFNPPENTREIALGDKQPTGNENTPPPPPTLRLPGEPVPTGGEGKVQFPTAAQPIPPPPTAPAGMPPAAPHIL